MFEGLFQPLHMMIILAIALIIFGPGKLPELGKGLGKSIREFKKAISDAGNEAAIAHQSEKITNDAASSLSAETRSSIISEV
jgi:sec-independent protein translocase protein TatA